jgi:hypothetical protein
MKLEQYFTSRQIIDYMLTNMDHDKFDFGEIEPCVGSGGFMNCVN